MKPLKLIMQAYGTFAQKTIIDFQQFEKEGVFLISGSNGSGKTTIFDAISFALYGETNSKSRNTKTVHSDFCSVKEKTYVILTFSHQNKIYTVKRSIEYKKEKGEFIFKPGERILYEGDIEHNSILSEGGTVDTKIKEMLGLTKDEFAQTVMIAQGEFRKIVDANSKNRTELFRKLFHTEIYQTFEKKLKERYEISKEEYTMQKNDILGNLQAIQFHSEFQPDKSAQNILSTESYLQALQKQNLAFEKTISEYEQQKETCRNESDNLIQQITQAQQINKNLQELARQQNALKNLQNQAQEIQSKKILADNAKRALQIIPIEENGKNTRNKLESEKISYEKIKKEYFSQESICKVAEQDLQTANYHAQDLDALLHEENHLKNTISKFDDLQKAKSNYQKYAMDLQKFMTKLESEQQNYQAMDKQFYLGQAGLLAEQLQSGKPCPVCGSLEHPEPAMKAHTMPTKLQLDAAKKSLEQTEIKFHQISETCTKYHTELETLQNQNPLLLETDKQTLIKKLNTCHQTIQELKTAQDFAQKAFTNAKIKLEHLSGQLKKSAETIKNSEQELLYYRQAFKTALKKSHFATTEDYQHAKLKNHEIQKLEQEIRNYDTRCSSLQGSIDQLEQAAAGTSEIAIDSLQQEQKTKEALYQKLENNCRNLGIILNHNQKIADTLPRKFENYQKISQKFSELQELYYTISGNLPGQDKLTLEAYAQQYYFRRVILQARQRLSFLTDCKFDLRHRETAKNKSSKSGLDLEILDRATNQWRDATTLSGGESFMLALSLALGLSDAIQETTGGIQIDAMFIDEGFGSLDETALNQAVALLGKLADGKHLIGIISHVESLMNRIDSKIYVTKKATGSEVSFS